MGIGLPQLTFTKLAGHYEATIGVLEMSAAHVSQMLPSGTMKLAPQAVTSSGKHPVVFLFGRHTNAHLVDLQWLYNENYYEFIVGIPYVTLNTSAGGDDQTPLYYLPRLYLDEFWSVAGGVFWWGFEKKLAQINDAASVYSVRGYYSNQPLISLATTSIGVQMELADFPFLFPDANMISQPLLTKVFSGFGPWATSTFDWHWSQAKISATQATMTISNAFLPGLSTGKHTFPSIETTQLGAFRISTDWTLSLPASASLQAAMPRTLVTA